MKAFDIYIAYVSWGDGGKTRPVLIIEHQEPVVFAFNITTQYETKNEATRTKYFKINDWKQAGLDRQSYVDTNTVREIPSAIFHGKREIGRLTAADELRLLEFMA
jgi:mRNA interferase MazF